MVCFKFTTESDSKRIVKIGKHLWGGSYGQEFSILLYLTHCVIIIVCEMAAVTVPMPLACIWHS